MRVLFDTNVYVSALLFGGVPLRAIERARRLQFTCIASDYLITELRATLASRKFGLNEELIGEACAMMFRDAHLVAPSRVLHVARDIKDDPILASALAGGADVIVSGDRDLLVLEKYEGIAIVSPRRFLDPIHRKSNKN